MMEFSYRWPRVGPAMPWLGDHYDMSLHNIEYMVYHLVCFFYHISIAILEISKFVVLKILIRIFWAITVARVDTITQVNTIT